MKKNENTTRVPQAEELDAQATPAKKPRRTPTRAKAPIGIPKESLHPENTLDQVEELESLWEEDQASDANDPMLRELADEPSAPFKRTSLFHRAPSGNSPTPQEKPASMKLVCKKSGLSEHDIYMMLELGYENELGRLIGYDLLNRLKSDLQKIASQQESHRYTTSFGYRGKSFVSNTTRQAVIDAYVSDRKIQIVRLLVTAVCTLLLLFIDQPSLLEGTAFGAFAAQNRRLLDGFGLALLIPAILMAFRPLYAGLRAFFAFSPTAYTFPSVVVPIAVLYSTVVIILQGDMIRVNFLLACVLLVMAICDIFRLSCELRTFRLVSNEEIKYVLTEATPKKKKLRHNNKIVKIVNDDLGKNIYEVHATSQTVGFFRRVNAMDASARPFTILTVGMLAASVLFAFWAVLYTDNLASALSLSMTALMISMPLTAFFAFFYPICRANRILSRKGCALIGEEAVEELEGEKTVVFRDTMLYNVQKSTEHAARESANSRNNLHLASALFRKLGGTMNSIGTTDASDPEDPQISIVRIHDVGIEAMADNRTHILAGSADFLRHGGVRVPREAADSTARAKNVSVMYLAIDGVLKLSYEIEYETNPSFEQMIADLAENDISVAISSYDPNLNEFFLQNTRDEDAEPITVRKPGRFEEDKLLEKADTAVVALNDETDVVFPLYAAKGISTVRHFGWRLQLISSILGFLGVFLLMILNPGSPLGISSVLGYQAIWMVIFTLSAHAELSESRFRFRG